MSRGGQNGPGFNGPVEPARTYRLAPADRTGALLGLSHRSIAVLAVGLVAGVLAFSRGAAPLGLAVGGVCVGPGDGSRRWRSAGGDPADPAGLGAASVWSGRHRWLAPRCRSVPRRRRPPWPPALEGQVFLAVGPDQHGMPGVGEIGVVHDRRAGTVSATVAVAGRHFGLVDRAEQDAALARWGDGAGRVRARPQPGVPAALVGVGGAGRRRRPFGLPRSGLPRARPRRRRSPIGTWWSGPDAWPPATRRP